MTRTSILSLTLALSPPAIGGPSATSPAREIRVCADDADIFEDLDEFRAALAEDGARLVRSEKDCDLRAYRTTDKNDDWKDAPYFRALSVPLLFPADAERAQAMYGSIRESLLQPRKERSVTALLPRAVIAIRGSGIPGARSKPLLGQNVNTTMSAQENLIEAYAGQVRLLGGEVKNDVNAPYILGPSDVTTHPDLGHVAIGLGYEFILLTPSEDSADETARAAGRRVGLTLPNIDGGQAHLDTVTWTTLTTDRIGTWHELVKAKLVDEDALSSLKQLSCATEQDQPIDCRCGIPEDGGHIAQGYTDTGEPRLWCAHRDGYVNIEVVEAVREPKAWIKVVAAGETLGEVRAGDPEATVPVAAGTIFHIVVEGGAEDTLKHTWTSGG